MDLNQNTLIRRLFSLNTRKYKFRLKKRFKSLKEKEILCEKNILKMINENYLALKPYISSNEKKEMIGIILTFGKKRLITANAPRVKTTPSN